MEKHERQPVNLANDPRHALKLSEMQGLPPAEMRRRNDPSRLWNRPADGLTPPAGGPLSGQGKGKGAKKRE
jgi:choline-sulfatase